MRRRASLATTSAKRRLLNLATPEHHTTDGWEDRDDARDLTESATSEGGASHVSASPPPPPGTRSGAWLPPAGAGGGGGGPPGARSARALRDQIRRLLARPMRERTHFLRVHVEPDAVRRVLVALGLAAEPPPGHAAPAA
jgi:hypothetical protein